MPVKIEPQALERFRRAVSGQRVLISTHVHPDPDAIGSVLAVREMLIGLGAEAVAILEAEVPRRCQVLPGSNEIVPLSQSNAIDKFSVAVIVDSGSLSRIGDVESRLLPNAVIVNIDHHVSNDEFGAVNFVCPDCCATGEVLYRLCIELSLPITPGLARNLYAGILTDTGRFRYSNTTPEVLRIAADLAQSGADVTSITDSLYFDLLPHDVLSTGVIFSSLEFFGDGAISTMFVRLANLVEDPDTIVDAGVSIRGVRVSALLSETTEGKIRVSLRSRSGINVSKIAQGFGGGGHEQAAGFRMRGTLESVRERLLTVLLDAIHAKADAVAAGDA
jgi:bifunctional oligoribonuclease and PAP phosphatase NrnA